MSRIEFTAENLTQLHQLINERIEEIAENFEDKERYSELLPREINTKILFQPEKHSPEDVKVYITAEVKMPPRKAKPVLAALRQGKLLIEQVSEDQPLFEKSGENDNTVAFKAREGAIND